MHSREGRCQLLRPVTVRRLSVTQWTPQPTSSPPHTVCKGLGPFADKAMEAKRGSGLPQAHGHGMMLGWRKASLSQPGLQGISPSLAQASPSPISAPSQITELANRGAKHIGFQNATLGSRGRKKVLRHVEQEGQE